MSEAQVFLFCFSQDIHLSWAYSRLFAWQWLVEECVKLGAHRPWGLWRHPCLSHWARQHCKVRDWNVLLGVSLTDTIFFFLSSTRLQFLDINTIYWKVTYSINFVNKIDTKKNATSATIQDKRDKVWNNTNYLSKCHNSWLALESYFEKGCCQRWVASSFMSSFLL